MEEKVVLLKIKTNYGIIEIPFLDLKSVDLFTVRYANREQLIIGLNRLLNLSLLPNEVRDVYVYSEYISRKNLYKSGNSNVKYSCDNFDIKTLGDVFSSYLKKDHNRIRRCGVKDINTKAMYGFIKENEPLSDFDVDTAVKKYLANAPYRTYRKVYFMIKDFIKVNINRVVREDDKLIERNLSRFSSEDEHIQFLLEYASRGEEEKARVMDELSRYDLEELNSMLKNSHFGLFDGNYGNQESLLEDLYDLEKYTGLSIEELTEYVLSKHRSGRKR